MENLGVYPAAVHRTRLLQVVFETNAILADGDNGTAVVASLDDVLGGVRAGRNGAGAAWTTSMWGRDQGNTESSVFSGYINRV
jgi:hypothetical protein